MLAGLAMKLNWRKKRKAAGKPDCPNLVMSSTVQVVWEKFCRYWDVEPRYVPVQHDRLELTGAEAVKYVDENTIGVVGILGVTYHGAYEPIKDICDALDKHQAATGLDIPVHVDAASGGFVAPFAQPELEWDFRLPRVISINASGHKYGLVYPGIGWVVWRDKSYLPEELVFEVNYLGGNEPTFTLNFSRPGAQIVGQYYMFLRLGFDGYRKTHEATLQTAQHISAAVEDMGPYELISRGDTIPVFAFKLKQEQPNYTLYDVSKFLTMHGWQVPAYTFPERRRGPRRHARLRPQRLRSRSRRPAHPRHQEVTDFCAALKTPLPDRAGRSSRTAGRRWWTRAGRLARPARGAAASQHCDRVAVHGRLGVLRAGHGACLRVRRGGRRRTRGRSSSGRSSSPRRRSASWCRRRARDGAGARREGDARSCSWAPAPHDRGWLSAATQFPGTLAFNVSTALRWRLH